MPQAVVRIQIAISGTVAGTMVIAPPAQVFVDALGELEYIDLTTGNNTVPVPTAPVQATAVLIVPPDDNVVLGVTLKGVAGDTGVAIAINRATWIPFDPSSPPTSIVVTNGVGIGPAMTVLFVWV